MVCFADYRKQFSMSSFQTHHPQLQVSAKNQKKTTFPVFQQSETVKSAYRELSMLFKNIACMCQQQFQKKAEQIIKTIQKCGETNINEIKQFTEQLIASRWNRNTNLPLNRNQNTNIASYFIRYINFSESQLFNVNEYLNFPSSLSFQQNLHYNKFELDKIRPIFAFNNMVCLYKVGMFQQALKLSEILIKERQPVCGYAEEMRLCIMLKMGIKDIKMEKQSQQLNNNMKYLLKLDQISTMRKDRLVCFIESCRRQEVKLHIQNWYNLAIVCKSKNLYQQSITILQQLIQIDKLDDKLTKKCYILLAQNYQYLSFYSQAIQFLRKIQDQTSKQIIDKIWELKKKLKLQKIDKVKIVKMLQIDPRFAKLNFFQNQLNKIIKHQQKPINLSEKTTISLKSKQNTQKMTQNPQSTHIIKTKGNMTRKDSKKVRSTFRLSHNLLLNKKPSLQHQTKNITMFSIVGNPKTPRTSLKPVKPLNKYIKSSKNTPISSPIQVEALPTEKEGRKDMKQKTVTFNLSESSSDCGLSIASFIESIEERITQLIFDENFEGAMDEIKDAQDHLQQLQDEDKERALGFTLKLSKWCRQAGKQRYGTLLLKRVLLRYQGIEHRKLLLRQLGQHYEQLKEYKSAIEVNLQLVRLGQTECLDKVGQIHMLRQNFSQALKYYERYHQVRNDTYSLVKLAHAYSKIPSYSKRAIDLLNDLLFVNKTSCIFRQHSAYQTDYFQSALLLLATIYMNLNGHKKAADICQKYLREDYSAYPIFYILGVLRLREQRKEQAFSCFLSAVRLKPNHLPSLLELLRFLTSRSSQVLAVLRKAFQAHHRDWELLRMLVEAATKNPCRHAKISIPALIDCARALEATNLLELQLQIQAIWVWAAELIDDRQRRMSVVDQQFVENVYVRLGEIALKKGNYLLSQRYFLKVLQKLQLERGRLKAKHSHYIKLELQVLRRMAYLKSERREPEAAISFLEKSRQLAKQNELPMEAISDSEKIGQLHFVMEHYQQAIQELENASKMLEQQPQGVAGSWEKWKQLQLEIGNCHQNLHQWRQARKVYQGILSHRLCEQAIRSLANLYAWQGSPEMAKQLLQGLRVLRPPPTLI